METTNQNNLDEIISQDTEKINNDEQTKSEIVYIEVDKLHPHDANPRKNTGDVTELADSIKKNGILQNLTVVPATGYRNNRSQTFGGGKTSRIENCTVRYS